MRVPSACVHYPVMLLAFDTSSAACTAALFDGDVCVAQRDELIGRGHSERLVPMIAELLDGRGADCILVGVGPGSFTGIRVAIAAAHGLAIGWNAELHGMSSLALLAAGAANDGAVAAAVVGGHGELFVQQFDAMTAEPTTELRNLVPDEAARFTTASLVIGSGAPRLVDARGSGEAREAWPSAANALKLPQSLRSLPPKPVYARAPDAKVREAA
ncbi:MAG TPA: tRNA (adenosine(37)-N6)-threonylcarbamoyltransferase complex dimerization subunit type 1 TsaB [Sphingomicrobium sp.]|nr:tRNA (adenosine(37)-N6)-threonylcarbamoyltransferase complex dimerization subunit type 1 TsaB [Sphingomicrobium sp.]